jgi:hypothetical protein
MFNLLKFSKFLQIQKDQKLIGFKKEGRPEFLSTP